MNYVIGALFVLYAAAVLALGGRLLGSVRLLRGQRRLRAAAAPPPRPPSLEVVIPVKDEQDHIAACLRAVLAQDYPALRIIVVNDRSSDRTGQIVRTIAQRSRNVRLVEIAELPAGCYGKPHALHIVAGQLKADCVAFVDSDLRLAPACLRSLVDHLVAGKLDWVAAMAAPEVSGFWERLLIPLLGAVTFAWYDPRKVGDPDWPDALGSGLMLCRLASYQAIGGHGAVIDVYDEDSELLRIAKRAAQRVSFVLAPQLCTQRHYGGLRPTIAGLTRTLVGGLKTVGRTLLTVQALGFVALLPPGLLTLLGLAAALDWPLSWAPLWWAAAGLHAATATALAGLVYHAAGVNRRYALLCPLGGALLIYVCLRALARLRRGVAIEWRGTHYRPVRRRPPGQATNQQVHAADRRP